MKKDSKRIINRNKYLRKRVQPQMRDVGVQSYNIDAKVNFNCNLFKKM